MPRVLLTRPEAQSAAFAKTLKAEGWDAVVWPVLEIETLPIDPAALAHAPTLILTSARAAEALAPLAPVAMRAICVGEATARAARKAGLNAEASGGDGRALAARLIAAPDAGPYLHLRGEDMRVDIAAALRDAGRDADSLVVYRACAVKAAPDWLPPMIIAGEIHAAAFFSPRSAEIFAALATDDWRRGVSNMRAVAISEAAAAPLRALGFGAVIVAEKPDAAAMRAAICGAAT